MARGTREETLNAKIVKNAEAIAKVVEKRDGDASPVRLKWYP